MLLLVTNTWLAGNKLAFFLLQSARERGASSATEDFSVWNTHKTRWPTLVGALVIGLIVGALAHRLMPGKEPMGLIITIIPGIAGSFVGGFIGSLIWTNETGIFRPGGLFLSVLGAILFLFFWRMVRPN